MNRWFNPSHPQTLQAAVFLGYFAGVLGLLRPFGGLGILLAIALIGGAFGTANSKRIGFYVLAVAAVLRVVLWLLLFLGVGFSSSGLITTVKNVLFSLNAGVFPVALLAAVLHSHSRNYQKIWFE